MQFFSYFVALTRAVVAELDGSAWDLQVFAANVEPQEDHAPPTRFNVRAVVAEKLRAFVQYKRGFQSTFRSNFGQFTHISMWIDA